MSSRKSVRRLRRALRRHGLRGILPQLVRLAGRGRAQRRAGRLGAAFDTAYGVRTSEVIDLEDLDIRSANRVYGVRHQASHPDEFRALMGALPMSAGELTFIDMGAGLGRALVLAGELPFRRIIGVEFSLRLAETARANVAHVTADDRGRPPTEVVCADVVDFELPAEPTLLYLYNPFGEEVLIAVMANVRRSLARHPRRFVIACLSRGFSATVLERAGFVRFAQVGPGDLFASPVGPSPAPRPRPGSESESESGSESGSRPSWTSAPRLR